MTAEAQSPAAFIKDMKKNPVTVPDVMPTSIFGLFWLVARRQPAAVVVMYITAMVMRMTDVAFPYLSKHIIDTVLVGGTLAAVSWRDVAPWLHLLLAVLALQLAIHIFSWWSSYRLRMSMQARLAKVVFGYVQRHATGYFDNQLTGKIAYRTNILSEQVFAVAEQLRWDWLPALSYLLISLVFFYDVKPVFALVLGGWLVVYLTVCGLMGRRIAPYSTRRSEAKAHITGRVADSITNIRNVIYYAAHDAEDRLVSDSIDSELGHNRILFRQIVRQRLVQHAFNISFYIAIFYGGVYMLLHRLITPGDFMLLVTLSITMVRQIHDLGQRMPDFFDMYGSAYDSINTLIVPHAMPDKAEAAALGARKGELRFENISFGYGQDRLIFNNLDLVIPPGQKVGLVGHSGGGKSTLVSLALRLYDVSAGCIVIDGQDIREVTQESLRRSIALIPQDTILFHRSMRDNIRYARPEASEAEVIAAAKQSHADEFIMQLPKGYDTLVGERGVKLSGGQRQRIAIARALLKNAPILLLDEATSALDSESEALIQQSMTTVMANKTVIAIAHRLSTLAHLDRLLVLDQGKIVEDGTHAELIASGGIYAQLWRRQSGGFLVDD